LGWMNALYETYDNCSHLVGKEQDDGTLLLPVAHSTQNAQVEVVVDLHGNFIRAEEVPKSDAITIIPVTEDSGTRSSGIAPHPLCDKLIYIAGDYAMYSNKANAEVCYKQYITQLEKWCNSEQSHYKVTAIFQYLKRGCLINDLLSQGIISLSPNGLLDDHKKVQNIAASDLFVRFRIEDFNLYDEGAIWKDRDVYDSYIDYILSSQEGLDLCYVSGKEIPCSYKHPAKVRHAADKAKLISANDEYGFTYRGRFAKKEQALSVGYLTSQKAHNVLRWLIERQGYTRYGISLVVWDKNDKAIPNILDSTQGISNKMMRITSETDIGYSYANAFNKTIDSYKGLLDTEATIHIISVDAATTGRLSINYYREIKSSDFYERLKYWHETCIWEHEYWKKDGSKATYIGAPSIESIVLASFGTEQNGKLNVKDELKKATIERLLPCILDKRDIPKDIIRSAIQNASRPMAFSTGNWKRVLNTTCALIKKDRKYNVEDWNMALDDKERDRSYLYGRLLAVANRVEYLTYEKDEKRQTNAKRYMQQFRNRPFTTWATIEDNLQPYFNKLKSNSQKIKYEKILNEIYDLFDKEEFKKDDPLDGMYLLGFHCQSSVFYNKNNVAMNDDENEEGNDNE
jgi:CRISPR-associated protein Csd1